MALVIYFIIINNTPNRHGILNYCTYGTSRTGDKYTNKLVGGNAVKYSQVQSSKVK